MRSEVPKSIAISKTSKAVVKSRAGVGGRPSRYTQEVADTICDQLSDGISLRKICEADDMPAKITVLMWLRTNTEFLNQYVRARAEQADSMADEITYIADTELDPNRARVRIDARKWVAAKLKPKVYGDKVDVTSNGDSIVPIVNIGVNHTKRELIEAETLPVDDNQKTLSSADYDGLVQNPSEVESGTSKNIMNDING